MLAVTLLFFVLGVLLLPRPAHARREANYDEAKVPAYTLPDPLAASDGTAVTDPDTWFRVRRPELVDLFATHVYGRIPQKPCDLHFDVFEASDDALDGRAKRRQVRITCSTAQGRSVSTYCSTPKSVQPVPVFLGSTSGATTRSVDPAIRITDSWMREREGVVNNRATEAGAASWPTAGPWNAWLQPAMVCDLLRRYPDFHDGFQNGVHPLFYARPNQTCAGWWGAIGAWSWG